MDEAVQLYMIARLESHAAIVDIYCRGGGFTTLDGIHVSSWWESLSSDPYYNPISLDALDEVLTEKRYDRISGWRAVTTASGAERFFADATVRLEDLDLYL